MDKTAESAKFQEWTSPLIAGTKIDTGEIPVFQPDPIGLWYPGPPSVPIHLFRNRAALLKMQEARTIRKRVENLLSNELDEDFPSDLGKEFWETMEKIALAWNGGLRDEVTRSLQGEGFSVEWFKWGHSSGFPVLVVKLKPTPEPEKVWGVADHIEQIIDSITDNGVACMVHP
jgi:hypothetical protein